MIIPAAILTYIRFMQGFSFTRNSPSLRRAVEDQQLQHRAIISIIDDDESMRCALKSLVTSLGFRRKRLGSGENFLDCRILTITSALSTILKLRGSMAL